MRVASVNQDPGISPGRRKGAVVHLEAMRRALAAAGAEVVPVDEEDASAVHARLEEAWSLAPLDLVYERLALGATAASEFAREKGVPLVVEVNAPLVDEARRWRGADASVELERMEQSVLCRATRVIAVSTEVAKHAIARGAPRERVSVLPNGVDHETFRPRENDELRRELVPDRAFVLGFHGRLRPWHGLDRLVDAAVRLLERGAPVHLLLVGEGDYDRHVAGRLPDERVTRVSWVDHRAVGAYVACFDALPLTYRPDQACYFSPLKLAEAMACGVVPLVPDLGDLARIVEHGKSGLVYDADDLDGLVSAVERLVARPELARELAAGAVRAAEGASWSRIAEFVLDQARPPREVRA